jgi:hypothetical protein
MHGRARVEAIEQQACAPSAPRPHLVPELVLAQDFASNPIKLMVPPGVGGCRISSSSC